MRPITTALAGGLLLTLTGCGVAAVTKACAG